MLVTGLSEDWKASAVRMHRVVGGSPREGVMSLQEQALQSICLKLDHKVNLNYQDGVVIHDEEMLSRWNEKYVDGYKMTEGLILHPRQEP